MRKLQGILQHLHVTKESVVTYMYIKDVIFQQGAILFQINLDKSKNESQDPICSADWAMFIANADYNSPLK